MFVSESVWLKFSVLIKIKYNSIISITYRIRMVNKPGIYVALFKISMETDVPEDYTSFGISEFRIL